MNIHKTLIHLIDNIHTALDELYYGGNCLHAAKNSDEAKDIGGHDTESRHFRLGQAYAYVECLEILQSCPQLRPLGLDYDIESRYPIT